MAKTYIAYYRVSTLRQGRSGLGLEAQRSVVERFLKPGDTVLAEFIEVETGKKNNRPQLLAAIQFAQDHRATLLIAKLDRLARNVAFVFTLRDADVDFIAADMPDANTLSVGIFASLAQYELEMISSRTSAALQQKKLQGFKLGSPQNLTDEAREKGRRQRIENAKNNKANRQAAEMAALYWQQGLTLAQIAQKLNEHSFRTRRGKLFRFSTVRRLLLTHATVDYKNTIHTRQQKMPPAAARTSYDSNAAISAALYRKEGYSLAQIARKLNDNGLRTATGKLFFPASVQRLLSVE